MLAPNAILPAEIPNSDHDCTIKPWRHHIMTPSSNHDGIIYRTCDGDKLSTRTFARTVW